MSSAAELSIAPYFASLVAPAYRRQTFEPELSSVYLDGEGRTCEGKPDYLCKQARGNTFIEFKDGKLNRHLSHRSSHAALQDEYGYYEIKSHSFLSNHFWNNGYGSGKQICLRHGFNHSLHKVCALQALHGWWNYIVVFEVNPKPEDAQAYCESGLIWCTKKTVHRLLASIDLYAHGIPFPFALHTTKYSVYVQPTMEDPALTPDQLQAARRVAFEAVIADANAAENTLIAKQASERAAEIVAYAASQAAAAAAPALEIRVAPSARATRGRK